MRRPATSMEQATRKDKAKRQEKMARLVGGQDCSERQWNYLKSLIGANKRDQIIRYVEWSNGLLATQGTLDRFAFPKVFMSRIFFIRAISMAKTGMNDLFTYVELLAADFHMTEAELLSSDEFEQFSLSLPAIPRTGA